MALNKFHNITGSTGTQVELLSPGDSVVSIKSLTAVNKSTTTDATVSFYIQDNPSSGSSSVFYITSNLVIPPNATLVLEEGDVANFNNSAGGFGLYIGVGASDTVDVLLNI